jgi:hypothetical protein
MDEHGGTVWKVFFVVAPDGLCYRLGQWQKSVHNRRARWNPVEKEAVVTAKLPH